MTETAQNPTNPTAWAENPAPGPAVPRGVPAAAAADAARDAVTAGTPIAAAAVEERDGVVVVQRPPSGGVSVAEVAGAALIKIAFPLEECKIIILDVDIVIIFPDGSKIILPGMALEMVSLLPPGLEFADVSIDAQKFLARIGEVKLAEEL
ncbi:MAG: hypothetical protein KDJ16_16990, partial [Hyphomicrobiales bacterium]|nr:hypothetical protein [Hyphomicrobiales bacterium]